MIQIIFCEKLTQKEVKYQNMDTEQKIELLLLHKKPNQGTDFEN